MVANFFARRLWVEAFDRQRRAPDRDTAQTRRAVADLSLRRLRELRASWGMAPGASGPVDYYVDALLRSNSAASQNMTDAEATRREIARILTTGFRSGDVPAPDRTYLAQVVAGRTGLSQEDADKRVSDVINQAKTALDDARSAAAKLSLWLTASLMIGAFCASLAATEGGYVRDNWNPDLIRR